MQQPTTGDRIASDVRERVRRDQQKRLQTQLDRLPGDRRFSEVIATARALLRSARPGSLEYEALLVVLYRMAALDSFAIVPLLPDRYRPVYPPPRVPWAVLDGLRFTYHELGYRKLRLLGGTDVQLLVAMWGEPMLHGTLSSLHEDQWRLHCATRA